AGVAGAPGAALAIATWAALMLTSIWVVPGAIGSFSVALSLYIPLSSLGGYALFWILDFGFWIIELRRPNPKIQNLKSKIPSAMLVAALVLAVVLGTRQLADPGSWGYVRDADLRAFDWIRQHTPP